MTSREVSGTRLPDQLDVKIRWVLHASMADVRPPARLFGRIVERLNQETSILGARHWRWFLLACRGLAMWLVDSAAGPPAEFAHCSSPRLGDRRDKYYLCLLMYQCDLPILLAQAM
jgi:hypothetical protein